MIPKNVGNIDAILRSILALSLFVLGLVVLEGFRGNILGILVALTGLIPTYMAVTRRCIVFHWFNISSRKSEPEA